VRQFALKESYFTSHWEDVKKWITGGPSFPTARFVRVDVNPYGGFWHSRDYDCYVITREKVPLDAANTAKGVPWGRDERAGDNAGKNHAISFDGPGFYDNACSADDWIRAALDEIQSELSDIRDKAAAAWLVAAGVIAIDPVPSDKAAALLVQQACEETMAWAEGLILFCDFLTANVIPDKLAFGDTLANLANFMAENGGNFPWLASGNGQGGLFPILRWVYGIVSKKKHGDSSKPKTAISYAIMDEHDYLDKGCIAPGDSIEIFLDATDPYLWKFIDLVQVRVDELAHGDLDNGTPAAFGGYISLRFMAQTESLIGMQKWPRTCSIEIAGLAHVKGVEPFLKQVEADAVDAGLVLHWGQRNNWLQRDVEKVYGPGSLYKWRDALSQVTDHGRYPAFSTVFSKRVGLEITKPIVGTFSVQPTEACADETVRVEWDCISNPPETQAVLVITPESGSPTRTSLPGLTGSIDVTPGSGRSTFSLVLGRELNGKIYEDKRDMAVRGISDNDDWMFTIETEAHYVDGKVRWTADINLYSQYISNAILVKQIDCTFPSVAAWFVRNPDIGDIKFTTGVPSQSTPSHPVFNKRWLFFSDAAAAGPPPVLQAVFKLLC
jgi:hypothetical protein